MSSELDKVSALRLAFDQSFAAPAIVRDDDNERLLTLRIAVDRYAIRLGEIAGLVAARKIVSVGSNIPGALGLAGIRGTLVPVYSLASLLGYPTESEEPRWFVLGAGAEPIALAFAQFEGYLEAPRSALQIVRGDGERQHVPALLRIDARSAGVISVAAVMATIEMHVEAVSRPKEL